MGVKKFNLPVNYNEISVRDRALVRNQYVEIQDGKCSFCHASLDEKPDSIINEYPIDLGLFPPRMLKYPVHLHHNHSTGMTISAVHAYCNCVLWQYFGE